MADQFVIAGRSFTSRLVVGTGKYSSHAVMQAAHEASGTQMVTVAVRRVDLNAQGAESLLHWIDTSQIFLLPNTAGCYSVEDAGAAAVMPLGAPIGSGLGIQNPHNLQIIKAQAGVPIIVDAGVGTASDAAIAMELGADGVLMNTAIAGAADPAMMAKAMRHAVEAGRLAYLAGRIPRRPFATPSSPREGLVTSGLRGRN